MEQTPVRKQRILSGIQPTGTPTLGNYIGAMRNWKLLEDQYDSLVVFHMISSENPCCFILLMISGNMNPICG